MKNIRLNPKKSSIMFLADSEDLSKIKIAFTGYSGFVPEHLVEIPNIIFDMDFIFIDYARGRSSVEYIIEDISTNHHYRMPPKCTFELLQEIQKGKVSFGNKLAEVAMGSRYSSSTFTLAKQGMSYVVQVYKE